MTKSEHSEWVENCLLIPSNCEVYEGDRFNKLPNNLIWMAAIDYVYRDAFERPTCYNEAMVNKYYNLIKECGFAIKKRNSDEICFHFKIDDRFKQDERAYASFV